MIKIERVTKGNAEKGDFSLFRNSTGFEFILTLSNSQHLVLNGRPEALWIHPYPFKVYEKTHRYGKTYRWKQDD